MEFTFFFDRFETRVLEDTEFYITLEPQTSKLDICAAAFSLLFQGHFITVYFFM